ncbi:F-box protein CPR1-like [Papaver somniferum]|uniref:F-box protein CPR1-like n=1 Tax=Papaver somniferum TaxID=3469 RepID=UPI000E702C58|nr:F-box protein CPR1-like [Papaver somniferum]
MSRSTEEDIDAEQPLPCLPEELILEILRRLPVESLLKFRCVRKKWNILFRNPNFIKNNNSSFLLKYDKKLYSLDYDSSASLSDSDEPPIKKIRYPLKCITDDLKILGCCNGLVCSRHCGGVIWNPTTNEYRVIPRSDTLPAGFRSVSFPGAGYISFEYGFGYDALSQDYKHVRIVGRSSSTQGKSEVDIYSLKSDSWKRIQLIPYIISNGPSVSAPGVFYNGALHWIAESYSGNRRKVLIALDVGNEGFQEIPQPENLDVENFGAYRYVEVLHKCLGMLCSSHMDGYEVWMMKDYGVSESWTKLYKIPTLINVKSVQSVQYLRKMEYLKNGEILLKIKQHEVSNLAGEEALVVYNPKEAATRILKHSENGFSGVFQVESYVKNLVPLNSGTYVGDKEQEEKDIWEALAGIMI